MGQPVTVPLPGPATFLTYGAGSIWAVGPRGTVWRVDSRTGRLSDSYTLGEALGDAWPAFGHGSLWLARLGDGLLLRFDPRAERVVARIQLGRGSDRPMAIAFSPDAVWIANQPGNTITRVDARSNKLVETIDLTEGPDRPRESGPSGLAVVEDVLWISEHYAGSVARFPISGGPVVSVCHGSPSGGRLVATDDELWLADAGGPVVSRVRPVDGSVVERFIVPGPTAGEIAVDGNEVWLASGEYLVRFDADAGTIDGLAALPAPAPGEGFPPGLTIALSPDAVWTTDPGRRVLLRFPRDPE